MEKRGPYYTVSRKVSGFSQYAEQYGGILKKLKTELPYDPPILLLDMYLDKTRIQKDTCSPVFIAALFTVAKTWKQLKCPLTDKWIRKCSILCTMDY